jgi:hypothetical protein
MTPVQFIAEMIEPPVMRDIMHVVMFLAALMTSLALGFAIYALALIDERRRDR